LKIQTFEFLESTTPLHEKSLRCRSSRDIPLSV